MGRTPCAIVPYSLIFITHPRVSRFPINPASVLPLPLQSSISVSLAPTPGPVSFPGAGPAGPKPGVITQLERGDEPWVLNTQGAKGTEQLRVDGSGAQGAHSLTSH